MNWKLMPTLLVPFGQVVENASEGTDSVQSSIDTTLGTNLENLFTQSDKPATEEDLVYRAANDTEWRGV